MSIPVEVTPPTATGEVAPPEAARSETADDQAAPTTTSPTEVTSVDLTSPLPGVSNAGAVAAPNPDTTQNMDNGELSGLSALPELSTPDDLGEVESGPTDLAAPSTVLPESLSTSNALDVNAPTEAATLPTTGDATEVTAPSTPTSPEVGTTPSDGPLEVVPPAGIGTPSIPPIGAGTPDPVGEVAPPVGWTPEADDAVSAFADCGPACPGDAYTPPETVREEADKNEDAQDDVIGDPSKPDDPTPTDEPDVPTLVNHIIETGSPEAIEVLEDILRRRANEVFGEHVNPGEIDNWSTGITQPG